MHFFVNSGQEIVNTKYFQIWSSFRTASLTLNFDIIQPMGSYQSTVGLRLDWELAALEDHRTTTYSWSLTNDIVGMSFDTTAANTGHLNGAVCSWNRKVAENCSGWLVDIIFLKYCVVTSSERFLVQRQVQM